MYLGISYVGWGMFLWAALAGTFGVIMLYRMLISYRPEEETYMSAAEIRQTRAHLRQVNRAAIGFGAAAAVLLILIAGAWAFHWFGA
jgi:hypothetical protein